MSLAQVREVAENTIHHILPPFVETVGAALLNMQCLVFCTGNDPGFITSDAPVAWWDSKMHTRPPLYRSPSLYTPELEITMPLSPSQFLMFTHRRQTVAYLDADDRTVAEFNRRTRFYASKEFVVRRSYVEPFWFDLGKRPPDSWEVLHPSEDEDNT